MTEFVSCEDALAPKAFDLFNPVATVTAVPLLLVPIHALRRALKLTTCEPALRNALIYYSGMLTGLFITNLLQHLFGPRPWQTFHEAQAVVQAIALSSLLNLLRLRHQMPALPQKPAALCTLLTTNVVFGVTFFDESTWLRRAACATIHAITAPFVVWTMGALSLDDPWAWKLFRASCCGLLFVGAAVAIEPHVCGHAYAHLYHALVDHSAIVLLFGSVSQNAVFLVMQSGPASSEGKKTKRA